MTWAMSWQTPRPPARASAAVVRTDVTPSAYSSEPCTSSQTHSAWSSGATAVAGRRPARSRSRSSAAVSRVGDSSARTA